MYALQNLRVFFWLLWRDLFVLRKNVFSKVVDAIFWSTSSIVVSSYILPAFGITQKFGLLIWVGTIVTMGFFESAYEAQDLVADREGNFHAGYLLTLPIPSWFIFIKMACSIAINGMVLSAVMVPLGKFILGDQIDLSQMSIVNFIIIFITMNLFFGFFAVWAFSWAKNPTRFSEVRRRIVNPLWQFGGYQFTWFVLYNTFPRLAILNLANPLTYCFEGMRSALLGPEDYLPFAICASVLWVFIFIFAYWAKIWLKQKLDYV